MPSPQQPVELSFSHQQPLISTQQPVEFELEPTTGFGQLPVDQEVTVVAAVAPATQPEVMAELRISVPSGVEVGQTLQFTPPGMTQPLSVVMQEQALPGSIITVQYPMQQAQLLQQQQQQALQGVTPGVHAVQPGSLPPTQLNFAAEDSRVSNLIWALYAVGCCLCIFILPICGPVIWVTVAAVYYCKDPAERAQLPRSRTAALTSAWTCVTCTVCVCVGTAVIVVILMSCATVDEDKDTINFDDCPFYEALGGHFSGQQEYLRKHLLYDALSEQHSGQHSLHHGDFLRKQDHEHEMQPVWMLGEEGVKLGESSVLV